MNSLLNMLYIYRCTHEKKEIFEYKAMFMTFSYIKLKKNMFFMLECESIKKYMQYTYFLMIK